MNIHKNARLTPHGRALLVRRMLDGGLRAEEAAHASGVSVRTAYKWLQRFRAEGMAGLDDRSSRPKSCPHALPQAVQAQVIEQRRSRQTYRQISQQCGVGQSTIARWLRRAGLNRLAALEPAAPIVRYEYAEPGDMLHLDIKKLGRFHRPGHRDTGSPQTARRTRAGRVGNSFMSRSTTIRESPLPTSSPMKAAGVLVGRYSPPCATTARSASPSGVS